MTRTLGVDVDENKLAYFAGLFDGEGCVNVTEVKPRPGKYAPTFQTLAQVSMTDRKPLDFLVNSFGGSIRLSNKKEARPIYVWRVYHKTAKKFLEAIVPYLIVKRPQAELLIKLEDGVLGRGIQKKLDDEEIDRRRRIKDKVCALNGPSLYSKYRESLHD